VAHAARDRSQPALERSRVRRCTGRNPRGIDRVLLLRLPGQQDRFSAAVLVHPMVADLSGVSPLAIVILEEEGPSIAAALAADEGIVHGCVPVACVKDHFRQDQVGLLCILCRDQPSPDPVRKNGFVERMRFLPRGHGHLDLLQAGFQCLWIASRVEGRCLIRDVQGEMCSVVVLGDECLINLDGVLWKWALSKAMKRTEENHYQHEFWISQGGYLRGIRNRPLSVYSR
jgi:hypothetical protein